MKSIFSFIRALLRIDGNARLNQSQTNGHYRGEIRDRSRPLYLGRGLVTMGRMPLQSDQEQVRD